MRKSIEIKPIDATYQSVKQILEEARKKAYSAVNFAMVQAYWNIGRIIVEEEQKGKATAGYGEYLLRELSERLIKDLGKGFDYSNVKNMRQFYLLFPIGDALRSQLRMFSAWFSILEIGLDLRFLHLKELTITQDIE